MPEIEDCTIQFRRQHRLKLPDALIAATALHCSACVTTRNVDDFKRVAELTLYNPFDLVGESNDESLPITQAQWRVVAALPKVNHDLRPDPANFKGDNRPIEIVSWYEAVEFCVRLSRLAESRLSNATGKLYRLPSEAEWEYACRAETTTPFHTGDTLAVEWANYKGDLIYGDGVPGEYRHQTTAVGQLGSVNAWGLADMHSNVWEWCLDTWHPSYDGAPTDGRAWIVDGDDRFRLLRGGSWNNHLSYCRAALRDRDMPEDRSNHIGFRVVCMSL